MWRRWQQWKSSTRAGVDVLTVYIAANTVLAIAVALRGLPWPLSVLMALCGASSIVLLWVTHLSDPGTIPARTEKDSTVALLEAGLPAPDPDAGYRRDPRGAWVRSVRLEGWNGQLVSKYCYTCHVWRPPRAHHCDECGACIARFDHHCGVVGNCVGGGNHRFFAGFLVAAQLGCILMVAGCAWRLRQRGFPGSAEATTSAETWVLLALAVLGGYHSVLLLFGTLHCCSVTLNITTKDLLRDSRLCSNPPCCPGGRSPLRLAAGLWATCFAPVRLKRSGGNGGGGGSSAARAGSGTGWLLEGASAGAGAGGAVAPAARLSI